MQQVTITFCGALCIKQCVSECINLFQTVLPSSLVNICSDKVRISQCLEHIY